MNSIVDLLRTNGEFGSDTDFLSVGGFVQGIVTDNSNKQFAGMVKVEFTSWEKGKNICEWMPVLQRYAGKNYGSFFLPEINDIVLVGFIGPGLKRPFVMGTLFPAEAQIAKDSSHKLNVTRKLKTKGGIELTPSDEKGKEAITAKTPKGLTLTAGDQKQTISLSDQNNKNLISINCQTGAIQVTAATKIVLKAGSCEISLDGNSGALNIKGGQITINATQKADLKGGQLLNVSSGVLKVEGKQTAELKGTAMTTISGGIVKIN
jgi:uncharacterized protein involved in type VI secretion and phage assembly